MNFNPGPTVTTKDKTAVVTKAGESLETGWFMLTSCM